MRAVRPGIGRYFTLYSQSVRTFRRLLGFLRPYRRPLAFSLLLAWLAVLERVSNVLPQAHWTVSLRYVG